MFQDILCGDFYENKFDVESKCHSIVVGIKIIDL